MKNILVRFYKNQSFAKDSFLLTISKVITGCIQLVITMLLSHFRTLAEYGTYSQMLMVINLVTSIVMLGLPNSISFFLGRAKEEKTRKDFLSTYFILNTIFSLIAGILMLACLHPIINYFNNPSISSYWFFLAFYPWAFITSSCIENLTVASGKTNLLIPFKLSHSVIVLLTTALSIWLSFSFLFYIILFLSIEGIFAFITYLIAYKLSNGFSLKINFKMIKTIFAFSLPIGLASAVGMLNSEIDKLMIGRFMATEQVAIYSNIAKELPIILIPTSITTALLPRVSLFFKESDYFSANLLWKKSIIVSLSIVSLFAFGCFVYAEDVISFLYGVKYLPGVQPFRVFCILLLFRATYWGLLLNASGNTKFIFFSSLCSLAINVALNIPFFFAFGMIGCAIATLVSTVVISFVQLLFTSKKLHIKLVEIFPWSKIVIILLINFAFAVVFWRIKEIVPLESAIGSFFESLILGFIWALLYFALLLFFKNGFGFKKEGLKK